MGPHLGAEGPARAAEGGPRGLRDHRRGRRRLAPPGGPARRDDRVGLRAGRLRPRPDRGPRQGREDGAGCRRIRRRGGARPPCARYEKAEQPEQYAALATGLPKAAAAVPPVALAERAAAGDLDPVSALGATVLGVEDRAVQAATHSTTVATTRPVLAVEATDRADRACSSGWGSCCSSCSWSPASAGSRWRAVRRRRPPSRGRGAERAALLRALRGGCRGAGRTLGGRQDPQHPGVAQGVGLDPLEVEELRDALVVGPQELGVDLGVHGLALDHLEAVPGEERRLEGEAEQAAQAESRAAR